jgi:hypothetical protein
MLTYTIHIMYSSVTYIISTSTDTLSKFLLATLIIHQIHWWYRYCSPDGRSDIQLYIILLKCISVFQELLCIAAYSESVSLQLSLCYSNCPYSITVEVLKLFNRWRKNTYRNSLEYKTRQPMEEYMHIYTHCNSYRQESVKKYITNLISQ